MSYLVDGSTDYEIDKDTTTLTVTPTDYGELTNVAVTRVDDVKLVNEAVKVNAKFTSRNPIPSGSKLTVKIPIAQFVLQTGTSVTDLIFRQLSSSDVAGNTITPSTTLTSTSTHYEGVFDIWCSTECPEATQNLNF